MVYEYACVECGHEWEAEQRITEGPLSTCPACGKPSAKRLVTGGAGFLLKGGGWYSDLYGLKSGGGKDSKGSSSASAKSSCVESSAKSTSGESDKPAESAPAAPAKKSDAAAAA